MQKCAKSPFSLQLNLLSSSDISIPMAAKKKSSKRKRYSEEEKNEIISFVEKINAEKGRGGVAAAVRKFGASPISINSWLSKKGGAISKGRKGQDVLGRLVALRDEIAQMEREMAAKRKEFEKLKKML